MPDDTSRQKFDDLREAVRERLSMADVCVKDGLEGRREGSALRARCPFHEEKSASFLIGGRSRDRAHCFGCGWGGDIFAYWMERKGVTFHEAINQLASLCGLAPVIPGVKWLRPRALNLAAVTGKRRLENKEKPALPVMRALRAEEIEQLAKLRGLSVAGVRVAAQTFRRVGFCRWPQFYNKRANAFQSPCEEHWWKCRMDQPNCRPVPAFSSWVITDSQRWVAQYRKFDGGMYVPKATDKRDPFKSWTVGTSTWPVGASELGNRANVILVEGGADMLAAYHFLHHFGRLNDVGVVCMLGASNFIAEAAFPFFKGKRVRIICDNDEEKVKKYKRADGTERTIHTRPGSDAAARWTEQLTEAGACVKTFFLGDVVDEEGDIIVPGLVKADGSPVGDLNDLAYCLDSVIDSADVRDAFCQWKEGFGG